MNMKKRQSGHLYLKSEIIRDLLTSDLFEVRGGVDKSVKPPCDKTGGPTTLGRGCTESTNFLPI